MGKQDATDRDAVLRRAMDLLARREHSREQLRAKLAGRGFALDVMASVLDELERQGLQSDERFVDSYARTRIENGFGPVRIRAELSEHGVEPPLIEAAIDEHTAVWRQRALAVCAQRFPGTPSGRREWARRARFLQRRGFPSDLVVDVLDTPPDRGHTGECG